jgi:hypothetical protein
MNKRKFNDIILYTNLLFFLGTLLSFLYGKYIYGSLTLIVSITSTMHHYYYEKHPVWALIDWYVSLIVVCYNFTQLRHFIEVYKIYGLLWYSVTIYFYFKARNERIRNGIESYDYWHKYWHISGGLGNCLAAII